MCEKKYPYHGAASIIDYVDEYLFDGVYLLLAEDGSCSTTDGLPVLQYVQGKFWVNNHAHILQGKSEISTEHIKLFFNKFVITPYITGAVQPKITQQNLNSIPFIIPPLRILENFNGHISKSFRLILYNNSEIQSLTATRDYLLPRLLSGDVRVE